MSGTDNNSLPSHLGFYASGELSSDASLFAHLSADHPFGMPSFPVQGEVDLDDSSLQEIDNILNNFNDSNHELLTDLTAANQIIMSDSNTLTLDDSEIYDFEPSLCADFDLFPQSPATDCMGLDLPLPEADDVMGHNNVIPGAQPHKRDFDEFDDMDLEFDLSTSSSDEGNSAKRACVDEEMPESYSQWFHDTFDDLIRDANSKIAAGGTNTPSGLSVASTEYDADGHLVINKSDDPHQPYVDHREWHKSFCSTFKTDSCEFKYDDDGALQGKYTAAELLEWINGHRMPGVNPWVMLTTYIQKSPIGCLDRFMGGQGPHCLLKECPLSKLSEHGLFESNIKIGDYMLAFEETWNFRMDPFAMAGFVHLYCAERFLNLPALTLEGTANLEADTRYLPNEPKGKNACALKGVEVGIVNDYIKNAYMDQMNAMATAKPDLFQGANFHANSLTKKLHVAKWDSYSNSSKTTLTGRGNEGTHAHVHQGDLEIYVIARMLKAGLVDEVTFDERSKLYEARRPFFTNTKGPRAPAVEKAPRAPRASKPRGGRGRDNKGKGKARAD